MSSMPFWKLTVWLLCLQLAAAALAAMFPADVRPLTALVLMTTFSMAAAAGVKSSASRMLRSMSTATACSILVIFAWRSCLNPIAIVGAVPSSLESPVLLVLALFIWTTSAIVALTFRVESRAYRFRWGVFGTLMLLVSGLSVIAWHSAPTGLSPDELLRHVVELEKSSETDNWGERQQLSTALAMLGRPREARQIATLPNAVGHDLMVPPQTPLDSAPPFAVTPWREAILEIAQEHRLVLIMEAHNISEHRGWIEQTLPVFREAGFTHYLAEAIAESGSTLKSRGYPTNRTGYYTRDPRFGNLLRTAIRLDFEIAGYDLMDSDFDRREDFQATSISEHFAAAPQTRVVVHAGHGHVLKHTVQGVGDYMAARLWKKTGVEPFTIWQWSNEPGNFDYANMIDQIGPIEEPVLVMPPPENLTAWSFQDSTVQPAVDAIILHPPDFGAAPTNHIGVVSQHTTASSGTWLGHQWPVIIAAHPAAEPVNAIAVDQIMLRSGETDFDLCVPRENYDIRVWGLNGKINVSIDRSSDRIRIAPDP